MPSFEHIIDDTVLDTVSDIRHNCINPGSIDESLEQIDLFIKSAIQRLEGTQAYLSRTHGPGTGDLLSFDIDKLKEARAEIESQRNAARTIDIIQDSNKREFRFRR